MKPDDYQAALDDYDNREAEIKRLLPHLEQRLPPSEYRRIEALYRRELTQMDDRRPILGALAEHERANR